MNEIDETKENIATKNYEYQIADKKNRNKTLKTVAYYIDEEFRIFPGNPRYLVSNRGNVYDMIEKHQLIPFTNGRYNYFNLKGPGITTISAHRMEMLTFKPIENASKLYVNHIDAKKTNNILSNLEWCTPQENVDHAVANNLIIRGESSIFAEHTEKDILAICYLMAQGKMPREIADILGITYSEAFCNYISKLRTGAIWNHITKYFKFPDTNKHNEKEIIRICELLSEGKRPFEVVDIIENEIGLKLKETFIESILYRSKNVQNWKYIIDRYTFPNLRKQLMTEKEIHTVCKLMEQGLEAFEILQIMGKEPTSPLISLLRGISNGTKWTNISSQYNILGKLPYILTPIDEQTIHNICYLLEQNKTSREISNILNIPYTQAFAALVSRLRNKKSHINIVSQYNF